MPTSMGKNLLQAEPGIEAERRRSWQLHLPSACRCSSVTNWARLRWGRRRGRGRERQGEATSSCAVCLPFTSPPSNLLYLAGLSLMIINICMQMEERERGQGKERERETLPALCGSPYRKRKWSRVHRLLRPKDNWICHLRCPASRRRAGSVLVDQALVCDDCICNRQRERATE